MPYRRIAQGALFTMKSYYCIPSVPLINASTKRAEVGDLYTVAATLQALSGECWREFGGRKKKGSASVSEDPVLKRVTAAAEERSLLHNALH